MQFCANIYCADKADKTMCYPHFDFQISLWQKTEYVVWNSSTTLTELQSIFVANRQTISFYPALFHVTIPHKKPSIP